MLSYEDNGRGIIGISKYDMGYERVKWFTGEERVRRLLWKKLDAYYDK